MPFARRAGLAACLAVSLAVAGCSAPDEAAPEPPISAPPSQGALPVPTTPAQALTVAAEVLRTASYRFTVDYSVPAHREHTIDLPDCDYRASGHTDATARILRAVTLAGGRCGLDLEELAIADETWVRKREGDVPWPGWVSYDESGRVMQGLTPWLLAERLNSAVDFTGTATEIRGRVDMSVPDEAVGVEFADHLLGHLGIGDETDVAFTLTLGADSRPAAFAFGLPFNDGVLTVDYTFGEYGLAVAESPPTNLLD